METGCPISGHWHPKCKSKKTINQKLQNVMQSWPFIFLNFNFNLGTEPIVIWNLCQPTTRIFTHPPHFWNLAPFLSYHQSKWVAHKITAIHLHINGQDASLDDYLCFFFCILSLPFFFFFFRVFNIKNKNIYIKASFIWYNLFSLEKKKKKKKTRKERAMRERGNGAHK